MLMLLSLLLLRRRFSMMLKLMTMKRLISKLLMTMNQQPPKTQCANPTTLTKCATSRAVARHSHANLTFENSTNQQRRSIQQLIACRHLFLFESATTFVSKALSVVFFCFFLTCDDVAFICVTTKRKTFATTANNVALKSSTCERVTVDIKQ